ncbi:cytochrome b pre-mRNA-processing protein 3 [Parvibaculum indicum]|uniref:ubiquinol-cytochrome C chaperone family protein n=1 Tax=Parvibaculum indicum TaxID=562969 RepID=UPI00141FEE6F|nr:ubiquinol-cytochrome C chaperone family protein [Parvibaculum indicum]NIJ39946.1 cytochrome b pre-mRNA-processing protein 3 [Parvibaculum indicum]
MIWNKLFRRPQNDDAAFRLYRAVSEQARRAEFYRHAGVPDTVESRFEMVALHAFLAMHRLKQGGDGAKALGQRFFDVFFDDLDQTMREMGVGDLSVGKKVKKLASSFYGRISAYEAGLAGDRDALREAIRRNIYGDAAVDAAQLALMAAYAVRAASALTAQPEAGLTGGEIRFPAPPAAEDVAATRAALGIGEPAAHEISA